MPPLARTLTDKIHKARQIRLQRFDEPLQFILGEVPRPGRPIACWRPRQRQGFIAASHRQQLLDRLLAEPFEVPFAIGQFVLQHPGAHNSF